MGFSAGFILESIGIEIEAKQDDYLGDMLAKFGNAFPKTKVFSEYARSTLGDVDCRDDPDQALMAWMEREEIHFRTLERHLIKERLEQGFSDERIEEFIAFSLSVQNRRKCRVGYSLDHHMEKVFKTQNILYKLPDTNDKKTMPDFHLHRQQEYYA